MAEKLANTRAAADDNDEIDAGEGATEDAAPAGKTVDAFDAAFNKAEKELGGSEPKVKAKAKPAADAKPVKAAEKSKEKPAPADDGKADDEEDAGEDDDDEPAPIAAKVKRDPNAKFEPKPYWSNKRKQDFPYQPREVQEAWLAEAPTPNHRWPEDQKAVFAKQPREVQEAWLAQSHAMESGFGKQFQELAGERKLAEAIRSAVPPQIRAVMQQRGLDEVGVFSGLLKLQQQSMESPLAYVRDFIHRNRIPLESLLVGDDGTTPAAQKGQNVAPQADIESHPVVRAMQAKIDRLSGHVAGEIQQRETEHTKRIAGDVGGIVAEKDEGGALRYPFVRLLAPVMAQILEADPEQYASMGVRDRFVTTYQLALEAHPELKALQRTAKPAPVDEQDDEDADTEEDADSVKLKKAATKKSKAPQSAPNGIARDPFDRAFSRASKQLGLR